MNFKNDEILGISPFVHLRREKTKIVISQLPHLSLRFGLLNPVQAAVFTLMDGNRTVSDIGNTVADLFDCSQEKSKEIFQGIISYITPDGSMLVRDAKGKKVNIFSPFDYLLDAKELNLSLRLEAPVTIMLQLTYACEANCIYCYAQRRSIDKSRMLPVNRIFELLDEMNALGIHQVNMCGGDPFCHPDIFGILEHALNLGMTVDLSTKAYMDEVAAYKLDKAGLDYLQVSIDAHNADIGDILYGRMGHYERVLKTLKNLQKTGVFIRTNSIITRYNFPFIEDTILKMKSLGITEMKFTPAFLSMYMDTESFVLNNEELKYFEQTMAGLTEKYKKESMTIFYSVMPDPTRMTDDERKKYWFETRAVCSSGRCSMIISPDGKAYICEEAPQTDELCVGDAGYMSIKEIWNSEAMTTLAFPDRQRFTGQPCAECSHFDACVTIKGHCFKDAFKGYGNIFTANPFCPQAKKPLPRIY